ncbi:hypothetical protein HY772_00365 [Candidatus Woesearchaeota archaeon]|nr:hypothetical protein [Candidatus Woesearchaeota archaeon]
MVFWIFKRKKQDVSQARWTGISERITAAFTKLRSDLSDVDVGLKNNEKQFEHLNKWVEYLYSHQQVLHANQQSVALQGRELTKKHAELDRNHKKIQGSNEHAIQKLSRMEETVAEAHKTISNSSQLTRKELDDIKTWLNRFSVVLEHQKTSEKHLKDDMGQLQEEIQDIFKSYKTSLSDLEDQNNVLKDRVGVVESALNKLQSGHEPVASSVFSSKSEYSLPQSSSSAYFEKHLIARVKPNRRPYIMNLILETVAASGYSTKEIEDIVVKEKQLCGRTTFYAYIKELRDKGKIDTASINDRQILVTMQNKQ